MSSDQRGPGEAATPRHQGHGLLGPRIVALAVVALAVVLIVTAFGISRGGGYQLIGPGTIPLVVAFGLLVLGAIFAARTTVRPDLDLAERAAEEEGATHWPTVGLVALALLGYGVALDGVDLGPIEVPGLGFIVATALFLPAVARILGSRALIRDIVVGVGIGVIVYFGFTEFLGVRLPAGILDPIL